MKIKLSKKFAEKHLESIISAIYKNYDSNPRDSYIFDLTEIEYIANQELLVITSLFTVFVENNIDFQIELFKKGVSTNDIPSRVRKQIIELWEIWEIWRIVPNQEYDKYFGLDGNSIDRLKELESYYPKEQKKYEIFDKLGVTPFVPLEYINNYDANEIQNRISEVFVLQEAIKEVLTVNKCFHPFTSNSLSTIITEELYLNFIDHSLQSAFKGVTPFAAMSITFKNKFPDKLLYQNEFNFKTEQIPEVKNFYYDKTKNEFYNRGIIEFSFVDFGAGIPETLKPQFPNNSESEILKFAFKHNTSRHPITVKDDKYEEQIPRGLFDVLTIVRRYKGLLIVRSNRAKIIYNFNYTSDIEKAFCTFGNESSFFPGTLISIYIPSFEASLQPDESSIKPETTFSYIKPQNKIYVNINQIINQISKEKSILYSQVLQKLRQTIFITVEPSLVLLSFEGSSIEDRIAKKILIYLLTDYDININNNVVILHSPKVSVIESVVTLIDSLSSVYKKYKIHPLPIVTYKKDNSELHLKWLGIYDDIDKSKLNELLYEEFSIAKSDFNEPSNLDGHILSFDTYGNLLSNLPNAGELIIVFNQEDFLLISRTTKDLLESNKGVVKDNGTDLYLCNGNYYQREYIEINNVINTKSNLSTITQLFYRKLIGVIRSFENLNFIGITSTSNKLLKSFIDLELIPKEKCVMLNNYHSLDEEIEKDLKNNGNDYVLICDVISTGILTKNLLNKLNKGDSNLKYIGVIVSAIDENFRNQDKFLNVISEKLICLLDYKIEKFEPNDLGDELYSKNIIRINPYTNIPIRLSFSETNYNDSIIFHSNINYNVETNEINFENNFLNFVDITQINVGYLKFNNLIHPYFFNTNNILNALPVSLLSEIVRKINKPNLNNEKVALFYPSNSGIKSDVFFTNLKTALRNDNIEEIEIDRINTDEGWRFPHNSSHLSSKVCDNLCLIVDDGSSTGNSLIQMIDEISFYNPKEIIVLCFIGRIQDHKREFFSRLASITVKNGNPIGLSIFFATHWHIPTYYLDNNPILSEIKWIDNLKSIPNVPENINKIASRIKNAILPKEEDDFKDYKYLPKIRDTKTVPKLDLLLRREEIGKVIGYRLYQESFTYFNAFIKKYNQKRKKDEKDRYQEIELICACFVYEPYLYNKFSKILPDVIELIEDFVRVLVYKYEIYEKYRSYDWDKRDIIHLFFIVFKNEKLISELTTENFIRLIEFTKPKESSLDYVLYKLTKYIPLSTDNIKDYSFDLDIKTLIKNLIKSNKLSADILKNYLSFTNTLPSRKDFNSQLFDIQTHYEKQEDKDLHLEKKQFGHYVSAFSSILGKLISSIKKGESLREEDIKLAKTNWRECAKFIEPILTFTSSFDDFLKPWPFLDLYNRIEGKNNDSVRTRFGEIENGILLINSEFKDKGKLERFDNNIKLIQDEVDADSMLYHIIFNNKSNLSEIISNLKSNFEKQGFILNLTIDEDFIFSMPTMYSEKLICKEIFDNVNNHSETTKEFEIKFAEKADPNIVIIQIKNYIKPKEHPFSKREGLRGLNSLSRSGIFGFEYEFDSDEKQEIFTQRLTFIKLTNGHK